MVICVSLVILHILQRLPLVFDDLPERIFHDRILDCSNPLIPLLATLCGKSKEETRLVVLKSNIIKDFHPFVGMNVFT